MGKFDKYEIDLKGMRESSARYEFMLDNAFFAAIDVPEVQKGKVNVSLSVRKTSHGFNLNFHTEGVVIVPCDRCLDDMEQPVVSDDSFRVKFGPEYSEEGEDLVIVPEDKGTLNVAWFMYEFVALAIPMKHAHAPGQCNRDMNSRLHKYLRVSEDELGMDEMGDSSDFVQEEEEVEKPVDPRWSELKKILDNN